MSKNKKVPKRRFTPFLVADKYNQFNTTCLKWTGDFLELIIVLLISAQINKLIGQILKENSEKNSTYFHRDHKLGGYPFHQNDIFLKIELCYFYTILCHGFVLNIEKIDFAAYEI